MARPTIHHNDASTVSSVIFATVVTTRRSATSRVTSHAYNTHMTGTRPANTSAVAFTLPTTCTTTANSAGYFQPSSRRARITIASIHGSPAHGSRITESPA